MSFDTQQLTVAKLFTPGTIYEFPSYQRPYRWQVDDADRLLNDLIEACNSASVGGPEFPYFVGSIVLAKRLKKDSINDQIDFRRVVIDGRQRLTTLFILLSVLRDLETSSDRKAALHAFLHDKADSVQRHEEGCRLRLNRLDEEAFARWVGAPGATSSEPSEGDELAERHLRFTSVAESFRRTLSKAGTDAVPGRDRLVDFLLHHCELIAITAKSEQQGVTLFQVLNGRGVELSETDHLRSNLISRLATPVQQTAADLWDDLDSRLGAKEVDTMLRSIGFVFSGTWLTQRDWADKLNDAVVERGVERFHDIDLVAYGDAMDQIMRREIPYSDPKRNPNDLIQGLNWLGRREGEWSEWRPLALEMIVRADGNEARIFNLIRGLDRMMYLMFINNTNEENRRRVCRQVLAELASGKDPLHSSGALTPQDWIRQNALQKLVEPIRFFNVRGALTRRAEAAAISNRGESLPPGIDNATVEHVLPQNPKPRSNWRRDFPGNEHRNCLDLLGNAILLNRALDSNIGSAEFSQKRAAYLRYQRPRPLSCVTDVCKSSEWTPSAVRARTKQVAETLAKAWDF